MELAKALQALQKLQENRHAYAHAQGLLTLDSATGAPRGSAHARNVTLGILSERAYQIFVNDDTRALLLELAGQKDRLTPAQARQVELLTRELNDLTRIPMEEVVAYTQLTNQARDCWVAAKEHNDYPSFKPYVEKLVEFNRRFAGYKDASRPAYNVLLDDYEKGLDMGILDGFFEALRRDIVPLLALVKDRPVEDGFLHGHFDKARQAVLAGDVMDLMGLDRRFFALDTSEHPFTMSFHRDDVRITTHYHEDSVASSLYSVIHEGGHALYDHNIAEEYQYTCLADGASMGLHESQSRFYENILGRSEAFAEFLLPRLRVLFPSQLEGVSPRQFYRAVNKAQPSLIRTEADELTYSLHVMVRYELEKQLFAGQLTAGDLPEAWNALYQEYLGVDVPDDTHGVLQDTHWSGGMFGYFPTYALGSAYSAQILHAMEKDLRVEEWVRKGELGPITEWLREKIHRHGMMLDPGKLLEEACGEPFSAKYYVAYLTRKMKDVYDL
ncbi:MAG: carboxypeptidase M32 [Clostridiales bacterium]|nr:carboxypeptidase M32 [Clostridiales bacterium]